MGYIYIVVPTQIEKMLFHLFFFSIIRAELANLNHCAVPFLSRAAVNLSWYDSNKYRNISAFLLFFLFHNS